MTIKNKTIFVAFALFCTCLNADPTLEELQAALAVNSNCAPEINTFGINEVNGLVDEAKLAAENEVKEFTNKFSMLPSDATKQKEKSEDNISEAVPQNQVVVQQNNWIVKYTAGEQEKINSFWAKKLLVNDDNAASNLSDNKLQTDNEGKQVEESEQETSVSKGQDNKKEPKSPAEVVIQESQLLPQDNKKEPKSPAEEIQEEKLTVPAVTDAKKPISLSGAGEAERNFSFENTYITRNSARVVQNAISNRMLYKINANEPIWVSINYSNSKQNETVGLGYKADTIGAVIGYDFINDSDMSFGAVAAFEGTDIDYSGKYSAKNANGKQYSGFAGLYGSYTDGCFDIYASSLLGYTNYKLNRLLENETSKLANSKYSGLSFCNKVSTDYMFESESFRFGPEASLYIDVVNQKKSTEKTATYTVNHNSNTDVYVSGEFGVKVIGKSKSAEKILVPHAFVGFYADLYKDNSKRKCHDNSGNVVKEMFNNKKHHSFVVKSGFDINVNDYISASLDYVGYISNNVITNEIAAAVSYKF